MAARIHEVLFESETGRTARYIIAHTSVKAILTALRTMPEQTALRRITCKTLCSIVDEDEPCAA